MASDKTIVHRWFEEVWNRRREAAIDELMAVDCRNHGLVDENGNPIHGTAGFKAFWRKLRGEFPNVHVEVQDALVDGDRIAVRCLVTATHAASGKTVDFTGMSIARLNGKQIVEGWNNYDFERMKQQLG